MANRLARSWDDSVGFRRVMLDLLNDRRGGRTGFPPRMVVELQILWRFRERQSDPSWRQLLREQARRAMGAMH